jgi:hypothetical protein
MVSYSALDALLNPRVEGDDTSKLRGLIATYADREEWVHAYLVLQGSGESSSLKINELSDTLKANSTPSPYPTCSMICPYTSRLL